ncbi:MAG: hypothetical protein J2P30_00775 [Actinobacteria bacterium]|nr:hypothetical protein [Actinomycetota bacterium]
MTSYVLPPWPPPDGESRPPLALSDSPERWLFGLAASREEWPAGEYEFRLPPCGLPLLIGHEEYSLAPSGRVPGDVGVARRFHEVSEGIVCLAEIGAEFVSVLWDVAERKRAGLSVKAHLDPPPGGGPTWVYFAEVSLTATPADRLARVVSHGKAALEDWQALTGEEVS